MHKLNQILIATCLSFVLGACSRSDPASVTLDFALPSPTGEPGTRPQTIPALREWAPALGEFRLTPDSRIVLGSDDAQLRTDAATFAEDLGTLTGHTPDVSIGGTVHAGDIELDLRANDAELNTEGYRLSIGAGIVISANKAAGAFYGTRSLLQLLHQSAAIPAGIARDWPRYSERGMMIDNGDMYYTPLWIQSHIREMAYLKLNYLHLHFSDGSFRIESSTHPEIVAADHLSKKELQNIIALAARYHIVVVPELDMPGHMSGALATHPEFQLKNVAGQAATDKLDITNPAARQFVRELMEEYLPLFPGPYWNIGTDEYLPNAEYAIYPQLQSDAQANYGASANAKDAIYSFVNWANDIVRTHGKTTRMWNDDLNGGSALSVDTNVIVEWWTNISPLSDALNAPGAQSLLNRGYTIMNASDFPTYYNAGPSGAVIPTADPQSAYENWAVNEFSGAVFSPAVDGNPVRLPPEIIATGEPRNLGSKIHVWGSGESESSIAEKIYPRLRIMAQKTWDSPQLTNSYVAFQSVIDSVGHAPDF